MRGLNPWPHASTSIAGARLIVVRTAPEELVLAESRSGGVSHDSEKPLPTSIHLPGTVIDAAGDAIRVATGDGVLRILALQPEGKRVMTAREFLAGRPIPAGTRLT